MNSLAFAAIHYEATRDQIIAFDPDIDDRTLADTLEGLTDIHDILAALVRSALDDEAMATGLKTRIADMETRRERLSDRASKRRAIARDVMAQLDLKKLLAEDFTVSLRPGTQALQIVDEKVIPGEYWEPREPRLKKAELVAELKRGASIAGVALSKTELVMSVRTK